MKKTVMVASAVLILMGIGVVGAQQAQPAAKEAAAQTVKKQTVCPVEGGAVNTNLYVDANGKRVYFCCKGCPEEFKKDPAKYITKLEKDGVTLDKTPATDATKQQATDTKAASTQACDPLSKKDCACCE